MHYTSQHIFTANQIANYTDYILINELKAKLYCLYFMKIRFLFHANFVQCISFIRIHGPANWIKCAKNRVKLCNQQGAKYRKPSTSAYRQMIWWIMALLGEANDHNNLAWKRLSHSMQFEVWWCWMDAKHRIECNLLSIELNLAQIKHFVYEVMKRSGFHAVFVLLNGRI